MGMKDKPSSIKRFGKGKGPGFSSRVSLWTLKEFRKGLVPSIFIRQYVLDPYRRFPFVKKSSLLKDRMTLMNVRVPFPKSVIET